MLRQVQVHVQVKGDLLIQPPEKDVRRLALLAKGEMKYDERLTPAAALRYYHNAQADIVVSGGSVSPRLDDERRLIAVDLSSPRPLLYSPQGPLTRDQLELLDVQGSSAVLDRLLPGKPTAIGDDWNDDNETLAALLGLDIVHQSSVTSTLTKVADGLAVVEFTGQISGAIDGIPSDVNLNGTYTFDLSQKHVTSLALSIDEKRPIGPAAPGFDVTARIEVLIDPLTAANSAGARLLNDAALASLPKSAAGDASLLALDTPGAAFRLLHGRRWRLVNDDPQTAVLRLVDHGDVVTQCNVHRLPDLEDGKQPTLEQFHADVKKSLGKNYGRQVDSETTTTSEGLRMLRVAVEAEISEVPVRWNYYHLSDDQGRQATCVFTLQQASLPRLDGDDLGIATSLQLRGAAAKPATENTVSGGAPTPAKTSRRTSDSQSK